MSNLLVFSRNILTFSGGAEQSLLRVIGQNKHKFKNIVICGLSDDNNINNIRKFPFACHIHALPDSSLYLKKLPYVEYVFRRSGIKVELDQLVKDFDIDEIWSQNLLSPIISKFEIRKKVFLRDESSIGLRPIYKKGVSLLPAIMYRIFDFPFFCIYKVDLSNLYKTAESIVSNSKWMAAVLKSRYSRDSEINYPDINVDELKASYNSGDRTLDKIVSIGSEEVKGFNTVVKLSKLFPDEQFVVYSKNAVNIPLPKNLKILPWCNDRSEPYRNAKLVLVPSLWNEAFGRVALEAKTLGIKVIVSNKGGLPEAVDYDEESIAIEFNDYVQVINKSKLCAG